MTDNGLSLFVRQADRRDSLDHLIEGAYTRAVTARGGVALLEQLWGSEIALDEVRAALKGCVRAGDVWVALEGEQVVAGALVREGCVQAIWVLPGHRRRRVATSILQWLLNSDAAPVDAWALPGDRATKSLYESVGWKARLLTMRGA
jgi:GNAT superfamily N-acetyltransferase